MKYRYVTRVAQAGYGSISVRGREMLSEEEAYHDFYSIASIAMGHRAFDDDELRMLKAVSNATIIGDPRLWPFRAPRLVGVYGDLYLTLGASVVFNSGGRLSAPAVGVAAHQLLEIEEAYGIDATLEQVFAHVRGWREERRRVAGYGVVARPSDERRDFLNPLLESEGWMERGYVRLTSLVDQAVKEVYGIDPNVISTIASVMLDVGLDPAQSEILSVQMIQWATGGNCVESMEERFAPLKRMDDSVVDWKGAEDRTSPRAESSGDDAR